MILQQMKSIIKYAIELDINYIETFLGYEGDTVLKITLKNQDAVHLIEAYIKNLNLKYKSEFEISSKRYHIYVGVEDTEVFKLKRD
jgi:predicted aldo/keto reductase-like oxidoreductase